MARWVQMNTTEDPFLFSPTAHTEQDLTVKRENKQACHLLNKIFFYYNRDIAIELDLLQLAWLLPS